MKKTLGIVGAGQLGRMMALAAAPLNIRCVFLDPARDACASAYGDQLVADYDDLEAATVLAGQADAATFEFENVPPSTVAAIAEQIPAYPPALALATSRDRWLEKSMFQRLNIPIPPIARVDSQSALVAAVQDIGLPAVLKTRTMGYDGKGQKVLRHAADLENAVAELGNVPLILEGFIAFDDELSCVAVRSADGDFKCYDLVLNEHQDGILYRSAPQATHSLQGHAADYVKRVMEELQYVGVMAFEFFRLGDSLMANEIAPRVHNSGHWTIEGAETSQFENHVRAVCGLPLGDVATRGAVTMLNVFGGHPDIGGLLRLPGVHWHDYDKAPRPGRKLGHVTVTAADPATLQIRVAAAEQCLRNDRGVA
ncbi:5-(carboxyamino)imidazole ribonucleotide synthase [Salinispirillum sp. LH 10-3-1]|uniref:N5-carboxyaminoimidazole ribonucleotide synthase n=1 Tax=Salinispirillum sp. LH 10-3-1 TaxID=2952525 RepID=A0AB38YGM3_9GAMM